MFYVLEVSEILWNIEQVTGKRRRGVEQRGCIWCRVNGELIPVLLFPCMVTLLR